MRSVDIVNEYLVKQGFKLKRATLGDPRTIEYTIVSGIDNDRGMILSSESVTYPFSSTVAKEITGDKTKTHSLAKLLGIATPDTVIIPYESTDISQAILLLDSHSQLVVKPHNGHQSKGVFLGIENYSQLENAVKKTVSNEQSAVVQEQFTGEEVRFSVIDGEVRAALLRQKPHVVGNGIDTVAQLIEKENVDRKNISSSMVTYPLLDEKLVDKSLLASSNIPAKNERLELNTATMIRNGASVYNVLPIIHRDYIHVAERLARHIPARVVCVDLMISDYKQPSDAHSYRLIEMNLGMSLPLCYSCRDASHFRIVEDYLGPIIIEALHSRGIYATA
jgi:D-alanine-D-alanine ligase-like ATP-grasp enzyme